MGTELEFLIKYTPSLLTIVAVIILIAYTKKTLFQGMISKEIFDAQIEREGEFVAATEKAASCLGDISKQLESIAQKISEELKQNTERLRTLELVSSDFLDQLKALTYQVEKTRKNIPETTEFRKGRTS
jgi:hypothetical protein